MQNIPLYKTFFMSFKEMSDVQRIKNYRFWRYFYAVWNPVALFIAILLSPLIILFLGGMVWLGILGEMLGIKNDEEH